MLPKGVFLWFGEIYWEEIWIKYQNTYILTILAPIYELFHPILIMNSKKSLFFLLFQL